jgi:predicted HNH restriction endonuclease
MGEKKRKPLRSNQSADDTKNQKKKIVRADKEVGSISNVGNNKTAKSEKGIRKSTGSTEEDDWELIEQQQALHDRKMQENDEESDDSEDDDEDDDDEIKLELEGNVQHVTEKYTFEFNDMRDDYAEGICVLLRSLVQNPTKAYELAKVISSQSEY